MIQVTFVRHTAGWQGLIFDVDRRCIAVTRGQRHPTQAAAAIALLMEQPHWFGIRALEIIDLSNEMVQSENALSAMAITPPPRQYSPV